MRIEVDLSDVQKTSDALTNALKFHRHRDEMNAQLHLAKVVRYSPLTSELAAAVERLGQIAFDAGKKTAEGT